MLLVGVCFASRRLGAVCRVYGCLLAVLIVMAGRKDLFGLTRSDFGDSVTSPMSLLRWGLLTMTALTGLMVRYQPYRASDSARRLSLTAFGFAILCLASSCYALVPNQCFMRAASLEIGRAHV